MFNTSDLLFELKVFRNHRVTVEVDCRQDVIQDNY